ncbi:VPLPA-CTERM sorting domain-containing protein [Celeribacter neptunius]|uniref:VPLPA-CTERM protein sorting domain-containing protein n=1 Tax=Celeribacter neptunius TaxID=588602 RepID=A0A1I3KNV2_9RHOB|nr:VPLPA-CTERM sorting domain-containing protein [Celeribacter neptunius]SFI74040.1 VPLPA-CTERM protein sorting domain-containing protein [Celeribacter neptunius]
MKKRNLFAVMTALGLVYGAAANAIAFTFTEDLSGVTMTASGSIDVSGLVRNNRVNGWGGLGIQSYDATSILGNTTGGAVNATYQFHAGTDFSDFTGAGRPYTQSHFSWSQSGDSSSFATYLWGRGHLVPGFSLHTSDLVGSVWSTDQSWFASGTSFASLGMTEGTYSITDSVSGENLSIVVARSLPAVSLPAVPLPASFPLLLGGLAAFGMLKRKKKA